MSLRGRGAAFLLSLILASCVSTSPAPAPTPTSPGASPTAIARDVAAVLVRVSAYDYAVAGAVSGERARVVTPDRYAAALAPDRVTIAALKDRVVALAFADPVLAAPLVGLADALVGIGADAQLVGDIEDAAAVAAVVGDVDAAWAKLSAIATALPADASLAASIARGTSWHVAVTRTPAFAVQTQPYGSADEANQIASRIGAVEAVAAAAPFVVRVVTTADRAFADRRVAELAALGVVAAVAETERIAVARSGPDPQAELWREGAVDIPTWGGARRAAFIAGGIVVVSADGNVFSFRDTGELWWHVDVRAGPTFATSTPDGKMVAVGGQFVSVVTSEGKVLGQPARLPSPAAGAVFVAKRGVFVAASQGPTGKPEGGGGRVVAVGSDAKPLGDPFPLVTPAAGPSVAASPAREEVYVATTSQGNTDVEVTRPGVDTKVKAILRVAGQVVDLAIDADAAYGVVVTATGSYRFRPGASDVAATVEKAGDASRDAVFGPDGTLYLVYADRLVAYDAGLRLLRTVLLKDGRRVLAGRRIVVQDGLARVLAVDPKTGVPDELAGAGELNDVAVSPDGSRVLLLADGRRALVFNLP